MRNPLLPRPLRRHRWDPRKGFQADPAPPSTVDVVNVAVDHGTDFDWVLYWEFSGELPESLTLPDLAGLTVGHIPPAAIVDRGGNWLMLLHHSEGGVGETWLVLPGGSPVFVPGQTGVVGEI